MSTTDEPPELRSRELIAALDRHGVRYLIVGGFGAQLHGATRQTKDLDLCPAWTLENFEHLADALNELGARLALPPELGDVEVLPNATLLREIPATHWRTRAGDVDVLITILDRDGRPVGYAALAPRAVTVHVGDVSVLVAALDDIIGSKERANRPKDREALPELRAIQAGRAPAPPCGSLDLTHDPPTALSSSSAGRWRWPLDAPGRGRTLGL